VLRRIADVYQGAREKKQNAMSLRIGTFRVLIKADPPKLNLGVLPSQTIAILLVLKYSCDCVTTTTEDWLLKKTIRIVLRMFCLFTSRFGPPQLFIRVQMFAF
jgi:hypothetical protein